MSAAATSLLAMLAAFARPAISCVELQGIVPGGGEGLLDLAFLLSNESIGTHPLAPLDTLINPPSIPIVSEVTKAAVVVDLMEHLRGGITER